MPRNCFMFKNLHRWYSFDSCRWVIYSEWARIFSNQSGNIVQRSNTTEFCSHVYVLTLLDLVHKKAIRLRITLKIEIENLWHPITSLSNCRTSQFDSFVPRISRLWNSLSGIFHKIPNMQILKFIINKLSFSFL